MCPPRTTGTAPLCELSSTGSELGRWPAARDRRGTKAARRTRTDLAQHRLDTGARLGREIPRSRSGGFRAFDEPGEYERRRSEADRRALGDPWLSYRLYATSEKLQHAFKTPTLRDVARRAPYMHDGSVATLADAIDLYDRGGIDRPSRSALIGPLHRPADEKTDLIAFLNTLTSDPATFAVPELPR